MEDKKSPSKKKSLHNQAEKVTRQVKCQFHAEVARSFKKRLCPDQSLHKNSNNQEPPPRVLVTINPRSPAVKTIFLAENNRFRRGPEKSNSLLAIGDHPSVSTYFSEAHSSSVGPFTSNTDKIQGELKETPDQAFNQVLDGPCQVESPPREHNTYKTKKRPTETCYVHAHCRIPSTHQDEPDRNLNKSPKLAENICELTYANYINSTNPSDSINNLNRRLDILKRLVRRQDMVLGDNDHSLSSSDESKDMMRSSSRSRPGCSYVEYSHVPETSAFQRYAQQSGPLSTNKGTTIEKEHNSEQYGRDFTTYDGLTARGRRQCASATTKRDDLPQQAAERMIKIRHKLNPVRDYRLMDTVHYLAQGEFAPRNDGIKLTPSREAVLSDIIWEDVCRTHWPAARLGRRHAQERSNTRCELQRLIDSLLRERVAHVERRRRRHYRIVKLNNRQETSPGRVGKTGDIIVASHKHKHPRNESVAVTGHNASGLIMSSQRWPEYGRRSHRSDEQLMSPERGSRQRAAPEECAPGPSCVAPRASVRREPTCCYQAAGPSKIPYKNPREDARARLSSSSSVSSEKHRCRNPRLVVKKDPSRRKYHQKEELNLEHFILLPTLVVRTPSNVKRQKKFNELYHRILNQLSTEQNDVTGHDRDKRTDAHSHRNFSNTDSVTSIVHGKNK